MILPSDKDVRYGASITMLFCFYSMDILFVNKKYEVVEKVTLKPWISSYTPKNKASIIIESSKNRFENVKIGSKIKIFK
jgi:uncharacterized membrane protein (UPF0127 family)